MGEPVWLGMRDRVVCVGLLGGWRELCGAGRYETRTVKKKTVGSNANALDWLSSMNQTAGRRCDREAANTPRWG